MPKRKTGKDLKHWKSPKLDPDSGKIRIVGGKHGGRQIQYSGDPITRPMKDDVREAVFNLVGGWVPGKVAFDLFAGTGAMGLEAVSRGAESAFLIERHFPTAKLIRQNINVLDPEMNATVAASDTFFWCRKFLKSPEIWPKQPWVVFCCPPYSLFVEQTEDLIAVIDGFKTNAPEDSLIVVESDDRLATTNLPEHEKWSVRKYSPAVISIYKKFEDDTIGGANAM